MSDPRGSRWLVEGAVIVGSILLAFAIDAAWDARVERGRARALMEALLRDFEQVRPLVQDHTEAHTRTYGAVEHFIDLVVDVPEGEVVAIPDTAIVFAVRNPSLDVPSGALDGALSSGGLQLIGDPVLRGMLAAWPSRLRDATEDDRLLREFWGPDLRRVLGRDINLIIPLRRTPPRPTEPVPHHTEVRVTNEMRSLLPDIRGSSGLAAWEEGALLLLADSIVARLQQNLGGG